MSDTIVVNVLPELPPILVSVLDEPPPIEVNVVEQLIIEGGGGGVTDATYLVGAAHAGLSAEIVVGPTPGGELGGTWAAPTVDTVHSGSSHAATQAAAEATAAAALASHEADTTAVHGIANTANLVLTSDSRLSDARTPTAHAATHQDGGTDELALDGSQITTGTVADARIASTLARDSEVTSAVAAEATARDTAIGVHSADTTAVHGIADTSLLETTAGAQAKVDAHVTDATDAHDASAISFIPNGSIAATDVQAAIQEVRDEAGSGSLTDAVILAPATSARNVIEGTADVTELTLKAAAGQTEPILILLDENGDEVALFYQGEIDLGAVGSRRMSVTETLITLGYNSARTLIRSGFNLKAAEAVTPPDADQIELHTNVDAGGRQWFAARFANGNDCFMGHDSGLLGPFTTNAFPVDADMLNSTAFLRLNDTAGAPTLDGKMKDSAGDVFTFSIPGTPV